MSTLQLEAPGGVAGCFERAGWMCCVEDNRTSPGRTGRSGSRTPWRLIPVTTREDAHLFREKVGPDDRQRRANRGRGGRRRTDVTVARALHMMTSSRRSVLLEHGCAHLILEPDYVHRLSPLQLAQKHSRRDLEDMFSSYVTATDRDRHWHHGRIESVSPPSQRGFFSRVAADLAGSVVNAHRAERRRHLVLAYV